MSAPAFCHGCGQAAQPNFAFCPYCGVRLSEAASAVMTKASDVPVLRPQPSAPAQPFNPYAEINEQNPIPDDSVWAQFPYPGLPPETAKNRGPIPARFVSLGTIRGRPLQEIQQFVGVPQSWTTMGSTRHATWSAIRARGGTYRYTLGFDPYDLCTGIVSQYNA